MPQAYIFDRGTAGLGDRLRFGLHNGSLRYEAPGGGMKWGKLPQSQWVHLAIVVDRELWTGTLYINGDAHQQQFTVTPEDSHTVPGDLIIGATAHYSRWPCATRVTACWPTRSLQRLGSLGIWTRTSSTQVSAVSRLVPRSVISGRWSLVASLGSRQFGPIDEMNVWPAKVM